MPPPMTVPASGAPPSATADVTAFPFDSTIGRKAVLAATGVLLVGFVVVHMLGNLQVYLGPEALDAYGRMLRTMLHGAGLWIARAVLLVAVVLHIATAWSLTRVAQGARPVAYRMTAPRASTYASRTMRWSGPILLLFVVYHLLHLTVGAAHPDFHEGQVYANVVTGFRVWPVSLFYILAMLALGLHLYHGIFSLSQSLGVVNARWDGVRRRVAGAITVAVVAGNISIPVAVLAGWVR